MLSLIHKRGFATKLMGGSTKSKRSPAGKRLGIKRHANTEVNAGDVLARQHNFKWRYGENVHAGSDATLHAT